jgi:hypothetical protein
MKNSQSNRVFVLLFLITALAFLISCGEASLSHNPITVDQTKTTYDKQPSEGMETDRMIKQPPGGTDIDVEDTKVTIERKIIYRGSLEIEVKDYKKSSDEFQKILDKYKESAYIHSSSTSLQYEKYRVTRYVIKIAPDKWNQFIKEVTDLGDLKSQSKTGEDVTEKYIDLNSRLKNKEMAYNRLIDLLNTKTKKLSDLLAVERQIERVSGEIEVLKGQIRYYDNLVSMATLDLHLTEKIPEKVHKFKFGESLKDAILDSLTAAWKLILFFITISIPGLVLILFFWFFIWLFIKIIKRSTKKKEKIGE